MVGEIYAANVDSSGSAAIVHIAASSVDGGVRAGTSADVKCVGAFDADFDLLDAACMPTS